MCRPWSSIEYGSPKCRRPLTRCSALRVRPAIEPEPSLLEQSKIYAERVPELRKAQDRRAGSACDQCAAKQAGKTERGRPENVRRDSRLLHQTEQGQIFPGRRSLRIGSYLLFRHRSAIIPESSVGRVETVERLRQEIAGDSQSHLGRSRLCAGSW